MPKIKRYNAVFIKPNSEEVFIENCDAKDMRIYLEILCRSHYGIQYPFNTYKYVLYDLRCRRNRINRILRDIIPLIEIITPPTFSRYITIDVFKNYLNNKISYYFLPFLIKMFFIYLT